jgi:hypothetical protein
VGTRDTYQRTLLKACIITGDETLLAEKLAVPVAFVIDWLLGNTSMPPEIFLRAVDIVLGCSQQQVQDTNALLERIRSRQRSRSID